MTCKYITMGFGFWWRFFNILFCLLVLYWCFINNSLYLLELLKQGQGVVSCKQERSFLLCWDSTWCKMLLGFKAVQNASGGDPADIFQGSSSSDVWGSCQLCWCRVQAGLVRDTSHVSNNTGGTLTLLCKRWPGNGCSFHASVPNPGSLHPKPSVERGGWPRIRLINCFLSFFITGLWNVSTSRWFHEILGQDEYCIPVLEILLDFGTAISTAVEREQSDLPL